MKDFLEKMKENLKAGIAVSTEKIEEYSKIGKLKLDITLTKRKIDQSFTEMGKIVLPMLESNKSNEIADNQAVRAIITKINDQKQVLKELEDNLSEENEKRKQKNTMKSQ
jgi:hypothetical protein